MDPTQWDAPFPIIVAALFCIVLVRTNATYWVGRLVAGGAHRTRVARLMDSAGYRRAIERVNGWGAPAVTVSFLTIGVQTLVNLAAGATRMPLVRYLPATIIGSVAWALLYGTVGFVGLEALALLWQRSPALAVTVAVVAAAGLAWFIARQARSARGGSIETEPEAAPTDGT
ncbi:DedA family protein [Micropruina sonneratiae]|uniref:DedA family protein n=1 Tax=Micropruina sonneratiae TaxID=2986940 RepID=UPI0022278D94|nr:VTT domain-containing protein [Micropruina sp. KQZ13P-5]MCW3157862.1 VTT domain-containing protein [Micropruina sp. KQZ13P-5]